MLGVEALIATNGCRSSRWGFGGPTRQLLVVDEQIECAGDGVEHDLIAVTDEPDGTADGPFPGGVRCRGPPFGPAHAAVGHAHQLGDTCVAKHRRYRDEIDLGHTGGTHYSGI